MATVSLPPAVALRGVHAGRTPGPALHSFDLEIGAGERLALLGSAGAGKSLVLDVLAGFVRPAAGEVLLDNRPAASLPPHRRGLGLVVRDDGPLPHLTVADTIRFAAHGEAGTIMQTFGLLPVADCRARDLSPEQRVRAALARALASRPRLVLLDEPFAALDAPAREAVLGDLLPVLTASSAAAVLATRDPGLALAFGDRAAVLAGGALLQSGPVQTLYDAPASVDVARLLGEANCLPCRVESVDGDLAQVRLECGPLVEADAHGAVPGHAGRLFIRPERIAVAAVTAADMGEGALAATVTALACRGDHVRLTLALGGERGAALLVKRPATGSLTGLAPGRTVAVAWQARHARVLA